MALRAWKKLGTTERFMVTLAVLFVAAMALHLSTIAFRAKMEHFGNELLGGFIDLRYGVLGASNGAKVGDWINVATFSLTTAGQEIGVVLEVYGNSRQTFALTLANSTSASLPPTLTQATILGNSNVAFSSAMVVQSANSGLASTYQLYLQAARANVLDIPVAWYLKGASTNDVVSLTNPTTSLPPAAGPNVFMSTNQPQSGSSVVGRFVRLETPDKTVRCMQFGEIQVYAGGANQSIGKLATQSTDWDPANKPYPASNLIDGNSATFAHTSCTDVPWMMVDLGMPVPILNIRLLNRADCCWQRACGVVVKILDANQNVVYTSDKIADKTGSTTYVLDSNVKGNNYMQYDFFPPSTTVVPSIPA